MSNLQPCKTCYGSKTIAPLGGILKECPACLGIGFIKSLAPLEITIPEVAPISEQQRGKPLGKTKETASKAGKDKRANAR